MAVHTNQKKYVKRKQRFEILIDGVPHYNCTSCDVYKPRSKFHSHKSNRFGITTRCQPCNNARWREYYEKNSTKLLRANKRRHNARRARDKRADAKYQRWLETSESKQLVVPVDGLVRDSIAKGIAHYETAVNFAEQAGVDESTMGKIYHGHRKHVRLETAERILVAAGNEDKLTDLMAAPGKIGWSKHSTSCLGCGTFFHAHQALGYCRLCYHREYHDSKTLARGISRVESRWSHRHERCISCGTTEREHAGKGLCSRCRYRSLTGRPMTDSFTRSCKTCGDEFTATNPKQRSCSKSCVSHAYRARVSGKSSGRRPNYLACVECHEDISTARRGTMFCSRKCRDINYNRRRRGNSKGA